jgi:hypothetical protein
MTYLQCAHSIFQMSRQAARPIHSNTPGQGSLATKVRDNDIILVENIVKEG